MYGEDYHALVYPAIAAMLGDGGEFRLTGFSFGSVLGSRLAAQFGGRVAGLSPIGASGFGPPEGRDLARIKCPLQLIWGENDSAAHPSLEDRVARCRAVVPGPRLDTIPGASHWAMYDSAAEANRLLLDFHRRR